MCRPNHSIRRRSWNCLSPLNFRCRLNFRSQSCLTDQILPGHTLSSTNQNRWLHRLFPVQQMALDRRQRPVTSRTQVHSARRVRQGSSLDDASRPPPIVHNFRPTSHTGLTERITRERRVGNPPVIINGAVRVTLLQTVTALLRTICAVLQPFTHVEERWVTGMWRDQHAATNQRAMTCSIITGHLRAGATPADSRLNKVVNLTIENRSCIPGFHLGAQILHHLIRV